MAIVLITVFGLCLGSFVNALVWRLHEQETLVEKKPKGLGNKLRSRSIVKGRSMCPNCEHVLSPKDLVPVLSWISLRGKCRYCKVRIPDTPLVELAVPVLALVSFLFWPFAPFGWTAAAITAFVLWILILTMFVALTVYDIRWYLLPDRIVAPLTIASLAFVGVLMFIYQDWMIVRDALFGALVVSGTFFVLWYTSKEKWIGGGDVKLGVSLGLLAGSAMMGLLVIFLASVLGTISAIPKLFQKTQAKTSEPFLIPFGPFLLLATFILVLFGTDITSWYGDLLVYEQV